MIADEAPFPRRKRGDQGKPGQNVSARPLRRADSPSRGGPREALDVAQYITDMTAQLEAMAVAAQLDLLAYFLGMAKAESELFVRTHAAPERPAEPEPEPEPEPKGQGSYLAENEVPEPHASNSFD